jgi:hypothetical protein
MQILSDVLRDLSIGIKIDEKSPGEQGLSEWFSHQPCQALFYHRKSEVLLQILTSTFRLHAQTYRPTIKHEVP